MKNKSVPVFLFVLILFISTVFSVPASAVNYSPLPTDYQVVWYQPQGVKNIKKDSKEFQFDSYVNGTLKTFYISFSKEKGIRFNTDKKGFFSPKECLEISYEQISEGKIKLAAASGMYALFSYGNNDWKAEFCSIEKNNVFSIDCKQIFFGFQYGKIQKVKIENGIEKKEVIYGFGGRINGVNQVGKSFIIWNSDGDDGTEECSYINVPILNSTKGYTLFYNSTYVCRADIGKSDSQKYSLDFNGDIFDAFIWIGNNSENMSGYTSLTGRPVSAPEWALHYWAGGGQTYWFSQGSDRYLNLIEETLKKYKEMGITPSALYAEGTPSYDEKTYDIADKYNTRILAWNYPDVNVCSKEAQSGIKELPNVKDYLNPYLNRANWCIDFTNPSALTLMIKQYTPYWNMGKTGLSGAMIDYGEYITGSSYFKNGTKGDEMHNLWAYYYCKIMNEAWNNGRKNNDFILFARAGCAGCQAYTANFTGDQQSTWDGLKDQVEAILSLSASGFNLVGGDLGGFFLKPSTELYMRWTQFSTFSPLMRAHGGTDCRDPWSFGARAVTDFKKYYWLRENIVDMIYDGMSKATNTGVPMIKSMPAAYPDSGKVTQNETQYLFCDSFLVCPVLKNSAYLLDVELPEGKWYDLYSGMAYIGNNDTVVVDAAINSIPVFVKSGAVVPLKLSDNFRISDEIKGKGSETLLITPPEDKNTVTLYTDDSTQKSYTVSPEKDGGFTLESGDKTNPKYLLLYGENATSITVDGKKLEKISRDTIIKKAGYFYDGANRTVVSLGNADWKKIKIDGVTVSDIAKGCIVYANSGADLPELTDGNSKTDIDITNDIGGITLDLGAKKSVGEIALKWGAGYAESYTVMGSENGKEWQELYISKKGDGGTEYIPIEEQKLRYISVTNLKKATGPKMSMYSFEVFGQGTSDSSNFISENQGILVGIGIVVFVSVAAVCFVLIKKKKTKT